MARSFLLFAALMFLISALRSQVIVIAFEATVNGSQTPLDSILVMNLTQGGDSTIYFPENALVLGTTRISEAGSAGFAIQALPNPFAGHTEAVLNAMGGVAQLVLYDVAGRELVSQTANLAAGAHRFRVSCERPGVHLLTVVQGGVRSSLRLMATEGAGVDGLAFIGGSNGTSTKSDRSLFTWTPGDDLRYIGYATSEGVLHSAAIDEVPIASATHIFVMSAGAICPNSPSITDIDGNVYGTVEIGDQCWMAANLKTTRYNDSTPIPNVTDNTAWTELTSGAWCNFDNESFYDATYGKLYNWFAAASPNICPQGWHIPAESEWQQLELALGLPVDELYSESLYRGSTENIGGKMKAVSPLWTPSNISPTNESGFSGIPCGVRYNYEGNFEGIDFYVGWWSASENNTLEGWYRLLQIQLAGILRNNIYKETGYCLRCVRD